MQRGTENMTTFVLIHGAYQGSWIWQRVANRLRAAGRTVYAPTLTAAPSASIRSAPVSPPGRRRRKRRDAALRGPERRPHGGEEAGREGGGAGRRKGGRRGLPGSL